MPTVNKVSTAVNSNSLLWKIHLFTTISQEVNKRFFHQNGQTRNLIFPLIWKKSCFIFILVTLSSPSLIENKHLFCKSLLKHLLMIQIYLTIKYVNSSFYSAEKLLYPLLYYWN